MYYHNITRDFVNITEIDDFLEVYQVGDIVYKSERGNAIIHKLTKADIQKLSIERAIYYDECEEDCPDRCEECDYLEEDCHC